LHRFETCMGRGWLSVPGQTGRPDGFVNGLIRVRQVRDDSDQLIRVNRFWYVHLETGDQRACAIFDSGMGGQRDGWNTPCPLRAAPAYPPDQFVPILLRHGEI